MRYLSKYLVSGLLIGKKLEKNIECLILNYDEFTVDKKKYKQNIKILKYSIY